MTMISETFRRTAGPAALALILAATTGGALAQVAFDGVDTDYAGRVRAASASQGQPIVPGSEVKVSGQNFKPGQAVTIARGLAPLAEATADGEGKFEAGFTLPTDAVAGMHPLVLTTAKPYHAETFDLKISPDIPLSGADKFTLTASKLVPGLYQTAYSARNDAIFVTSATGRPPVKQSALLKVDPATLKIVAQATPGAAPARKDGSDGGVYAVYGIGIDDAQDTVWVTNTRQDTVAVYKQSDLSLVRQFEAGTVPHARDVAVDGKNGKAYVSPVGSPFVAVFDTRANAFLKNIDIASTVRGKEFSPASLQFDAGSGKLYVVSLSTAEVAIVDTATDTVEKVFPVKGALNAIGIAYDAETNRVLIAGQNSDNLLIVDAASGETLKNVPVGAGALNVAFEPVQRRAFVANRDAGTVAVVDIDGNLVANLDVSPLANHLFADGKGDVLAVNKSRNPDDPDGDRIVRISPAK